MIIQRMLILILSALNIQVSPVCELHPRIHFGEPLPVMIRNEKLLEPTDDFGNIKLNYGDTITLSCEGGGYITHPNSISDTQTGTVSCLGGENFQNDEWVTSPALFSQFQCHFPPNYASRRTNRTCYKGNKIFEVGYNVLNDFYPVYESCFSQDGYRPIYSKYTQKPYNAHFQTRVTRPFFIDNDVYGIVPVNSLFSPRGQKAAVTQLVGTKINTYITETEFLSRGHLAAKTDFVFAFGERATFHYVNCAPQWYGFNSGNWNTLEVDLRNYINRAGVNAIIYTGTFGVSQLRNEYGKLVNIHLYSDENNNPIVPVPLYYYKVVYDINNMKSIAFVGINSPYYTREEVEDLTFCQDVCTQNRMFWLTWSPRNHTEGYAFCCHIDDFRRNIKHLPDFEVQGLFL